MEDKERANMVLKKIGAMTYFDPEAIVKVLVNEFELVRKDAAQQSVQATGYGVCEKCHRPYEGSACSVCFPELASA